MASQTLVDNLMWSIQPTRQKRRLADEHLEFAENAETTTRILLQTEEEGAKTEEEATEEQQQEHQQQQEQATSPNA